MKESPSYDATLKLVEATLEFKGDNYPYTQIIIPSFPRMNPK
jgi:hypothetical protein